MKSGKWYSINTLRVGLLSVLFGASGLVMAQNGPYLVNLKNDNSSACTVAGGAFSFTKNGTNNVLLTTLSVMANNCSEPLGTPPQDSGAAGVFSINGSPQPTVVVDDILTNVDNEPVPSVVGLTGQLLRADVISEFDCEGNATGPNTKSYTMNFQYNLSAPTTPDAASRIFTIECSSPDGGGSSTYQGRYHVNNMNTVPVPGSLWLLLAGFGGLLLSRRRGKRRLGSA